MERIIKRKGRQGLRGKLLTATLIPLILLEMIALVICSTAFSNGILNQIKNEMSDQCDLVQNLYDKEYPGDFEVIHNADGSIQVLKGGVDITNANAQMEMVKTTQGNEFSIFCDNERILTTITDAQGNKVISTRAAELVKNEVIDGAKDHFYSNIEIAGVRYFAFYKPMRLSNGSVYGMIGSAMPAKHFISTIFSTLIPLLLFWLGVTALVSVIIIVLMNQNVSRILSVQNFVSDVANGNFHVKIEQELLELDDELGDLARSGKQMEISLQQLVEYDVLTEIHNRRYADNKLKRMHHAFEDKEIIYCAGIADIDFFKKVNDTYGHDAGDEALRSVAGLLEETIRESGLVARWGGEEFLILFDGYDLAAAQKVAQRAVESIQKHEIQYDNYLIQVTISIGITQAKEGEELETVLRRADNLLYKSKQNGRNQVQAE